MDAPTTSDDAIRRTWGAKIAERMDDLDMSARVLVELLAEDGCTVSVQAVGQWRRGNSAPSPSNMIAVAKALRVEPRTLFTLNVGAVTEAAA